MTEITEGERLRFVLRVLTLFWEDKDGLTWRTDGEYAPISFFVNCNDTFWWGTADAEDLTPDNLEILETAIADVEALGEKYLGGDLFCARMRKMRPQGALYKHIPLLLWPLFDACGPERETDMMNPQKQARPAKEAK